MPNYIERATERFCPCCGNKKNLTSFTKNYCAKEQYLPLCNSCINRIYQKAKTKFNSEAAGICISAGVANVASIGSAIDIALERIKVRKNDANGFLTYYDVLKELGEIYNGAIDSDVCLGNYVDMEKKNSTQDTEEEKIDYMKLSRLWGRFTDCEGEPDKEAYEFLEDLFEKYTDGLLTMDTAMEYTYRDLCIAHWQKRKADEAGDISEVEKAKKQINNALSLLKLDKFQNNALSDEEKHIEHLIWEIENTTPAECEDLEKYKDFSGFEKAFGSIMRCVKNLVADSRDYPELTKDEAG